MAHIHTEPGQYDATASAFIVRMDGPEPALLLHKHRLLGRWLQLGGHVELHESPWGTIMHEIPEESGYALSQLKVLQPAVRLQKLSDATIHPSPVATLSHQFGDTDHYHTDTEYAFTAYGPPEGTADEGESTEFKAFTATELADIPSGDIPENVREVGLFILRECVGSWIEVDTSTFEA